MSQPPRVLIEFNSSAGMSEHRYRVVRSFAGNMRDPQLHLLKRTVDGMGVHTWPAVPLGHEPPHAAVLLQAVHACVKVHDAERRQWSWAYYRCGSCTQAPGFQGETLTAYLTRCAAEPDITADSLFLPAGATWDQPTLRWVPPEGWTEPDPYPPHVAPKDPTS